MKEWHARSAPVSKGTNASSKGSTANGTKVVVKQAREYLNNMNTMNTLAATGNTHLREGSHQLSTGPVFATPLPKNIQQHIMQGVSISHEVVPEESASNLNLINTDDIRSANDLA